MKKIFPLFLILSSHYALADEADDLLASSLKTPSKELIEESSHNKIPKKIPKQDVQVGKIQSEKDNCSLKVFDNSFENSFIDMFDNINKMWESVHKEVQEVSQRIDRTFKTTTTKNETKHFFIEDKNRALIMTIALPKHLNLDDTMLDVIDNKNFKIDLHDEDVSLKFSGVVTKNMLYVNIYSENKCINKKGNVRTSRHESNFAYPLIGQIKDLERNIKAEYDSSKHEIIITLYKETHSKCSIKILTR
jgi:hypothetical protein